MKKAKGTRPAQPAPLEVIILAAGKGTRMHSNRPKVLHELGGQPLLTHVINTAKSLNAATIHVVYGHGGRTVPDAINDTSINWIEQREQLGTGHAVQQALPHINQEAIVLIMYGDVPLVRAESLQPLIDSAQKNALGLLTATLNAPGAYGRIVRDTKKKVKAIVESKDATAKQLKIKEINTGFIAARAAQLQKWLGKVKNDNAKGEYYLTDIFALAVKDKTPVATQTAEAAWEILGINSQKELSRLERLLQTQRAEKLLERGIKIYDSQRIDIRGELKAGRDVSLDINTICIGQVELADGVSIGPNVVLRDVKIGANTEIRANSVIEETTIGTDCRIGPFARVRPGSRIGDRVHLGNFVEIKNASFAEESKANHLSYIGDAVIGRNVNIGAGTITCNYDGANKHETRIEDGAFIGSNAQLVAPVTIGRGATVGAGSTITQDVPEAHLAVGRTKQKNISGWKRKKNKSDISKV